MSIAKTIGWALVLHSMCLFMLPPASAGPPAADSCNNILGTQTFGPAYRFTQKPPLLETAERIRLMGASVIKFRLGARYFGPKGNVEKQDPSIRSLADLAAREPTHRQVLDMPFRTFVLWAHGFDSSYGQFRRNYSEELVKNEYREMYNLVCHLLATYSGTGKTFFLGHWEGDGWLRGTVAKENDRKVTPEAVRAMTAWLIVRQRAVDNAKRDTPHRDVQVWHYTEVNHVKLAMDEGRPALVNKVLPRAPVDFVSYSCYDVQKEPETLKRALDYIESNLTPKPDISGKRVFIGEYGFPAIRNTPAEQNARSVRVIRAGLEWGCPFVLYWAFYNNEVDNGVQRGLWMIDNRNRPQPIYETHRAYYQAAQKFVQVFKQKNGHHPSDKVFRMFALDYLREADN